jgi:hypothetical protein
MAIVLCRLPNGAIISFLGGLTCLVTALPQVSQNLAPSVRLLPQLSQSVIGDSLGGFCALEDIGRLRSMGAFRAAVCCAILFRSSSTVMGCDVSEMFAVLGLAGAGSFLVTLGTGDASCFSPWQIRFASKSNSMR